MQFLFFFSALAVVLGHTLDTQWHAWKSMHGKAYRDQSEEVTRYQVWRENLARIEEHNYSDRHNYTLSLNQFADLRHEEFQQQYLSPITHVSVNGSSAGALHVAPPGARGSDYPDRVDWRQKGFVTTIKNQGSHCMQSSWAFSATGAIEGQYYRTTGQLVSLSEQQLIDCSGDYGNAGCRGGHMVNAFKYVVASGGICKESDYSYLGYKWHCMSEYCTITASCVSYTHIKTGSEVALLDAVYRAGPISVGVDATNYHFQFYSDGVYAEKSCNSHSLNHGMLLVGYGVTYDGIEYWIVKNSWGSSWGDRGYMKIARNRSNMCGIATAASYPTVKSTD